MSNEKTVRVAEVWRIAWIVAGELDKIEANWLETTMVAELIKATATRAMVRTTTTQAMVRA